MKRIGRLLLILALTPLFFILLLVSMAIIVPMMALFSILAGRKWVGGIKWYTSTSRRDDLRRSGRRRAGVDDSAPDSVYDIRCDVLNVTPKPDDDKKPLAEAGKPSNP